MVIEATTQSMTRMEHGLQTSLKTYALLMGDKMAAGAFGLATNYGQDGTFNLFQAECIRPGKSLTRNGILTPTIAPKYSKQIAFKDIIPGTCNVSAIESVAYFSFFLWSSKLDDRKTLHSMSTINLVSSSLTEFFSNELLRAPVTRHVLAVEVSLICQSAAYKTRARNE